MFNTTHICFTFAIIGLLLISAFSPQQYARSSISELARECGKSATVSGRLTSVHYSQNNNLIGVLRDENSSAAILILLNDFPIFTTQNVTVSGRTSSYNGACWIFPERILLS